MLDKILDLMKNNNIGNKELAQHLGLTAQAVTDWKAGRSKSYTKYVYQIADYFNTTPEYLKGETNIEKALPEKEEPNAAAKRLMELYNELNTEGQEKLVSYADDLVTSGKYATFKIYRAAHSDTNNPAEIKNVGKEFVKALEEAPETDEKF